MARRTLAFLLGIQLLSLAANAQDLERHRYLAEVPGVNTLAREKGLTEALNDWDPKGIYHIQAAEGTAELLVYGPIDRTALGTHLAAYGFTMTELRAWNAATDALEPVPASAPDAYPVYPASGDRAVDNAIYGRAKAAWIEQHPQEYQRMTEAR